MAQNYTRQSSFADGDTITASLFNNEYNQLVNAFAYSSTDASATGHRHDGSIGQGGNISQIGDLNFNNKIVVDDVNNRWGFFVEVAAASVEQIRLQDGSIIPVTTNDIDLGSASLQFKDAYFDGTVNADSLVLSSGATVTAILDEDAMTSNSATALATQQSIKAYVDAQVTAQDLDFQGDTGGALSIDLDSETLTIAGGTGIDTSGATNTLTVSIDSTVATLTGTQTLTNKTLTSPDINGGTIDGAVIGATTAAAGSFTTVAASGNITVGGTVDGRDVATDGTKLDGIEALADVTDTTNVTAAGALMDSELTNITAVKALNQGVATTDSPSFAGLTAATADINGGTIDGTVIGGSSAAAGSFTTISASGEIAANGGVAFGDNDKAIFGAGSDLQIYHDASHSFIKDAGTGHLKIQATNLKLQDVDGNNYIDCIDGSYVRLMHNTATKLETTSTGIDVTGTVTADGATFANTTDCYVFLTSTDGAGECEIRLGDAADTDAGSISYNNATDSLILRAAGANKVTVDSTGIDVTGTVTANRLVVDNYGYIQINRDGVSNAKIFWDRSGTQDASIELRSDESLYINNNFGNSIFLTTGASEVQRFRVSGGGDISFYENTGTTAKFFWDASAESLGIGTTSPKTQINVASATGSILTLESTDTTLSTNDVVGQINFYANDSSTNSTGNKAFIKAYSETDGGNKVALDFATSSSNSATGITAMTINSDGNVGIGTTSPTAYTNFTTLAVGDSVQGGVLEFQYAGAQAGRIATTAANTLTVTTNNAERMRIDSSGNVGIGTTSPNKLLDIQVPNNSSEGIRINETGDSYHDFYSNNGDLYIHADSKGDNNENLIFANGSGGERMRIDSSGNVGIGTSSPSDKLHITGGSPSLRLEGTGGIGGYHLMSSEGSNNYILTFDADAGGSNGQYKFLTSGTERMRIDSSGNVGIGTSSPDSVLHLFGNTASNVPRLKIEASGWSNDCRIERSSGSDGFYITNNYDTSASSADNSGAGTSGLQLARGFAAVHTGSSGAFTERMRIDSSGNVGIGTSSPSSPLQVKTGTNENLAVQTKSGAVGITAYNDAVTSNINLHLQGTQLIFDGAGSAERMRIDSSGNLLVGQSTSTNPAGANVVGSCITAGGRIALTRDGGVSGVFNRKTSDGSIVDFAKDGSTVGSIGSSLGAYLAIGVGDTGLRFTNDATTKRIEAFDIAAGSTNDGIVDLGISSNRFDTVYAVTGTINTSDRNEKQDIESLSEAEQRVAVACKGLLRKFRWKSAVEQKGEDSRIHFGIIAQDLQAAFEAEGLDAGRYGMFIHSTWTDEETGEERSRMGVRYSELLAFIIAAI